MPILLKSLKDSLLVTIPIAILLASGPALYYRKTINNQKEILEQSESHVVELTKETVDRDFRSTIADLLILTDIVETHDIINNLQEKPAVTEHFLSFSTRKKLYDQVRFLDTAGNEIIRVNYNSGHPILVPPDKLQNKSGRYYFTDTYKLNRYELFVSPLDLNIEKSKIERPLTINPQNKVFVNTWKQTKGSQYAKPMIRFGSPVFDHNGNKIGITLLNYFGTHLLNTFDNISKSTQGKAYLLNRDGYWLVGPSPEVEWGFMQEHEDIIENKIKHTYPEAWQTIIDQDTGQFYTENGLFTFNTIHPLNEGLKSSVGSGEAFDKSALQLEAKDYFWKIVTHVPQGTLVAQSQNLLFNLVVFYAILILSICISIWSWNFARLKRHKSKEDTSKLSKKEVII